jgi:hypothetical protein
MTTTPNDQTTPPVPTVDWPMNASADIDANLAALAQGRHDMDQNERADFANAVLGALSVYVPTDLWADLVAHASETTRAR